MLKIQIKYYTPTVAEKFFIEKVVELLDPQTIDSYRLRMHNPLTILKELRQVISDLNDNKLKNVSYAESLMQEALFLIQTENELNFKSLSKSYYIKLLSNKNGGKRNLNHVLYSTNLIINDNENYAGIIFSKISSEIIRLNLLNPPIIEDFKILNGIIGYYFIELINRGFSKQYLFYFFKSIFFSPSHGNFSDRLDIISSLNTKVKEKFNVIIGISIPSEYSSKITILNGEFSLLKKAERKDIVRKTNQKIKDYFEKYKTKCLFYQIEVSAFDFYSSIKFARQRLQILFDVIHMGHSDVKISVIEECAQVGENNPRRANVLKIQYYLDGYYKSEQKLYDDFLNKIKIINEKKIDKGTLSRINSGLRYLRLGFDSHELENKILNYWIGLEYLFSPNDTDSYTVGRIREYFKKCHAIVYFKRNLKYLHDSIIIHHLGYKVPQISYNLNYLTIESNYDAIISEYITYPLLAYRANSFKEQLCSDKKTKDTIEKHQKNLDWNLNRIYRIRNEIVHNASIQTNSETITSHLRYYLVFILNGLMDFIINEPIDIDGDSELTIDDYFIMQEILIENIANDVNFQKFSYLLKMHNPVEYLS
ncbi:MAG: hypothetical protein IPL10_01190 [Bacteroidetes bacterium]|nr:hypothetical protein [Bacteroidota bacterium]